MSKIENSQKLKKMDKTMTDLQFEIVSRSKYITELKSTNECLIRKIEELNKRLDALQENKQDEKDSKNETIEEEKVLADVG